MKNKKLNIAFFLDNFFPQVNGVVTSSINTAKELARRGHNIFGIVPSVDKYISLPKDYFPFPIEFHKGTAAFLYPDFIFTSPFKPNVIKTMKLFKPDIIHFHAPMTLGYKAIFISKILSVPVLGTFHTFFAEPEYLSIIGMEKSKFLNNFGWWYSNQFFNRCDSVISPGKATAAFLKEKNLDNDVIIISNGVETSKFRKFKFNEKLFPLKINKDEEWILFVGRISKEKSIDILLEAFQIVIKKRPKAKLLIVGDGPYMHELKELVKNKNMESKVVLSGMIPNKNLLESGIIKKMKLFATASTSENQPMTILEAMMFGLPAVGPDAKGVPELIEGNGYIVKPNSPLELAGKIIKLLENKNIFKKFSNKSLELSKKYDIVKTTDKMEDHYFNTIESYKKKFMYAKIISLPQKREYDIEKDEFSFGRNSNNDISLNNDYISRIHCKIILKNNKYYIKDLNSQNGTFLNGILLKTAAELKENDIIKLSENGPSFEFIISEINNITDNGTKKTMKIFKNFFSRNLLFVFTYVVIFLVIITIFLLMNKNMFFFIKDYTLITDINKIMKKYQEKEYHMLNYEVILKVKNYINIYKEGRTYQIGLENRKKYINMIDEVFKNNNIPTDLSYLAFVESNFNPNSYNAITGAKGLWQLMAPTARQYGLIVNKYTDDRADPKKSTEAAAKYLKDLLSIYGTNSILLTMCSYNAGEQVIIYSLKLIKDPEKDRTFWYLYNNNLIPPETKDYVLKVLALKILSENPDIKLN